jgi:pyruvate dehydrogenase E2 component (dihydrolipoamide acetyltransferase)
MPEQSSARTEVTMPHLGYDADEGKIVAWLKVPGDHVERGEPIAEIETDKATIEMESLVTGTLIEIVCPAGSNAVVGSPIAYVELAG